MKMQHLSPILWTKDLDATIAFYTQQLNFIARSGFPNFVSLYRDEVEIMFVLPIEEPEECKEDEKDEEFFPRPILTGSLYITVNDVDELWESVKDNTTIISTLANREYQMRDFSIRDNNGYELVFGTAIDKT